MGQKNTAEGQCVRSVALSGVVKHVKRVIKVSRILSHLEKKTGCIKLEKEPERVSLRLLSVKQV